MLSVTGANVLYMFQPLQQRDGRALKKQPKLKDIMALERFLARSSGFNTQGSEQSLFDLGLGDMCPAHYHRPFALQVISSSCCACCLKNDC